MSAALAFAWPGAPPGHAHPPSISTEAGERAIAQELTAYLAELRQAVRAKDRERVAGAYSAGFTHIDADGRKRDRRQHLDAIVSGESVVEVAEGREVSVRSPNGWVAVRTGTTRLGGDDVRFTCVYTRAGANWQVAATQVTRIPTSRNPKTAR